MLNHILQEAVEETVKTDPIVAAIKKNMNVCKLSKFRATGECAKFYSSFFCGFLEEDQHPTLEQWGTIYTTLLGTDTFCTDLACYMALYQPAEYTGMFSGLMSQLKMELDTMKDTKVRNLHMAKSMIMNLQNRMGGVGEMVKAQVINPEPLKFVTVVNQVLQQMIFDISAMIQEETTKNVDKDAISYIPTENMPVEAMTESAQELIYLFKNAGRLIEEYDARHPLDEGVVNNAKMKAKEALIKKKKTERWFNEEVMKRIRDWRRERQNRKHSEMVGESLWIMRAIKVALRAGVLGVINPALGVIALVVPIIMDRATDKQDRAKLVNELKDEIEITDEKISQAEKNGDDKAKVELMRFKQRLVHEYERIQRVRFDANVRAKYGRD